MGKDELLKLQRGLVKAFRDVGLRISKPEVTMRKKILASINSNQFQIELSTRSLNIVFRFSVVVNFIMNMSSPLWLWHKVWHIYHIVSWTSGKRYLFREQQFSPVTLWFYGDLNSVIFYRILSVLQTYTDLTRLASNIIITQPLASVCQDTSVNNNVTPIIRRICQIMW